MHAWTPYNPSSLTGWIGCSPNDPNLSSKLSWHAYRRHIHKPVNEAEEERRRPPCACWPRKANQIAAHSSRSHRLRRPGHLVDISATQHLPEKIVKNPRASLLPSPRSHCIFAHQHRHVFHSNTTLFESAFFRQEEAVARAMLPPGTGTPKKTFLVNAIWCWQCKPTRLLLPARNSSPPPPPPHNANLPHPRNCCTSHNLDAEPNELKTNPLQQASPETHLWASSCSCSSPSNLYAVLSSLSMSESKHKLLLLLLPPPPPLLTEAKCSYGIIERIASNNSNRINSMVEVIQTC